MNKVRYEGTSMYPILCPGDWLYFVKQKPQLGDIILFYDGQELIAHRYIGSIVKGDRNLYSDDCIVENIIGVVIGISRKRCYYYFSSHLFMRLMAFCSLYSLECYGKTIRHFHQVILLLIGFIISWKGHYFGIQPPAVVGESNK